MSCCGQKRTQWRNEYTAPAPSSAPGGRVFFRYLGKTGVTVTGPVTGRSYQFTTAGATAAVDPRDAPSVAAVPHLQQIVNP